MTNQELFSYVDHTLLKPEATPEQIAALCAEAAEHGTASVCVNGSYVALAKKLLDGKAKVCAVIGFPLGAMSTAAKAFEAAEAIRDGADEIDMVIHIGQLKAGNTDYVLEDIKAVKAAIGDHILKVIIETCLLTEEEKITMCRLVTESGAEYIKTSTGFSTAGATFDDIRLLDRAKKLLEPVGFGRVSITTADKHDQRIAFTSQMAHVISNAYIKSPTAREHDGFSAGSYKDLTRVAWLNPSMWAELFLENKKNLLFELDTLIASLNQYRKALEEEDFPALCRLLDEGRRIKEEVDGK